MSTDDGIVEVHALIAFGLASCRLFRAVVDGRFNNHPQQDFIQFVVWCKVTHAPFSARIHSFRPAFRMLATPRMLARIRVEHVVIVGRHAEAESDHDMSAFRMGSSLSGSA